jgi:hypothetical protein
MQRKISKAMAGASLGFCAEWKPGKFSTGDDGHVTLTEKIHRHRIATA